MQRNIRSNDATKGSKKGGGKKCSYRSQSIVLVSNALKSCGWIKICRRKKRNRTIHGCFTGHMVGELAVRCFGEHSKVLFEPENMDKMLKETQRFIEAGTEIIAEASFAFGENFCSVDILRKVDGGYEIIEVKSSSGAAGDKPKNIMKTYGPDLAYQYYVLTGCGINVVKISLMQLNKEYVRHGALDLQQLFVAIDCTDLVLAAQDEIEGNIKAIKAVALCRDEPESRIRSACKGCGYERWCLRNLPENNIFDIGWYMRGNKKDEAYLSGFVSFKEVLDNTTPLNEKQLLQVKTVVDNLPPHIEPDEIRRFLNDLSYPLYHLDFETYQQPIPLWDGVKPYQQLAVQYSIHIQETPCAEPTHKEFLGKEGIDPRRELAEGLCADIPQNACVLAYNASFEKGRIDELAELFPDLSEHLRLISANIKDLAIPFFEGYYYCRRMGGGYTIKNVLPALCGDDPSLDYKKLEIIHNGGEAMAAYATLHEQPPEEIKKIRAALLAYCKLDTLAMVKVLEKLYEATLA